MRRLHFLPLAACLAAATVAFSVNAQENPPNTVIVDDSDQPAVTIRQSEDRREITERREQGIVKEVKVKSGDSTYYLKPKGAAAGPPGDAHGSEISVPQWSVKEFDLGQRTESDKETAKEPNPPSATGK